MTENIQKIVATKTETVREGQEHIDEHITQVTEYTNALNTIGEIGVAPKLHYKSIQEAYEHQNKLSNIESGDYKEFKFYFYIILSRT